MADLMNILSNEDSKKQPIKVTYPLYPEVFDRASIEVDPELSKSIEMKIVTETEMDAEDVGNTKEVKKFSMSTIEGEKQIDTVLNLDAFKGYILILQKMYTNMGAK